MARTQLVYDAAGNACLVRSVDAKEIIEAGGSAEAPTAVAPAVKEEPIAEPVAVQPEVAVEAVVAEPAKAKRGRKAK